MSRTIPAMKISKVGRYLKLEDIGGVNLGFIHEFTKHRKYTHQLLR